MKKLKDYYIHTKDFKYMQNFGKGKDHSGSKVKHLYVTNYVTGTFNHTEEDYLLQYRHLKKTNATKTTSRASNSINVRQ